MWRSIAGALVVAAFTFGSPAAAQVTLYDWSGFNVGNAWAQDGWALEPNGRNLARPFALSPLDDPNSGIQIGYNRHFGAWSFGLEGDWSFGRAEGCARLELFNLNSNCADANWYGTAAGRIGYAWDRLLTYTKGGAAFSQWDSTGLFNGAGSSDPDRSKRVSLGWVLGGGMEYAMNGAWSLRAEYTYLELSRDANSVTATTPNNPADQYDMRSHMLMFGLRHRM
jgi:outer membrane immunogenic protein